LVLFTEAEQDDGCGWAAYDGDLVVCDDCGLDGAVSAGDADDDAWINFPEEL
jgi:hypothetical protein